VCSSAIYVLYPQYIHNFNHQKLNIKAQFKAALLKYAILSSFKNIVKSKSFLSWSSHIVINAGNHKLKYFFHKNISFISAPLFSNKAFFSQVSFISFFIFCSKDSFNSFSIFLLLFRNSPSSISYKFFFSIFYILIFSFSFFFYEVIFMNKAFLVLFL